MRGIRQFIQISERHLLGIVPPPPPSWNVPSICCTQTRRKCRPSFLRRQHVPPAGSGRKNNRGKSHNKQRSASISSFLCPALLTAYPPVAAELTDSQLKAHHHFAMTFLIPPPSIFRRSIVFFTVLIIIKGEKMGGGHKSLLLAFKEQKSGPYFRYRRPVPYLFVVIKKNSCVQVPGPFYFFFFFTCLRPVHLFTVTLH